jgi:hypothetical protein
MRCMYLRPHHHFGRPTSTAAECARTTHVHCAPCAWPFGIAIKRVPPVDPGRGDSAWQRGLYGFTLCEVAWDYSGLRQTMKGTVGVSPQCFGLCTPLVGEMSAGLQRSEMHNGYEGAIGVCKGRVYMGIVCWARVRKMRRIKEMHVRMVGCSGSGR